MADMTETLLSEVIVELRKNREEIEKGNRDPSLASSIKQNAGEIGNAILLAGRSERFAKEERTTEVDDEIVTSREDNTTMLQQILNAVTDTNKKTPSPSKKKSEGKQERSFIKKLLNYATLKKQLDAQNNMLKAMHNAMIEQDRRWKLMEKDLKTFLNDSYPKRLHDERYDYLYEQISIVRAFIENLEKI